MYNILVTSASSKGLSGDSNSPLAYVGGKLRCWHSFGPNGSDPGGVKDFAEYSTTVESSTSSTSVNADQSLLSSFSPYAFGPWFEAVISDGTNLYAYYHTETRVYSDTKIHVKIGGQKSTDGGVNWTDMGSILIDTPSGTDIANGAPTSLGYGFVGGNGDCSALLDETGTYLYFIWSQYGATAATQGVAIGRMLWSDRDAPAGKIKKWDGSGFNNAGLGGTTVPVLANVGDAHGQFASQDYYWGPSVHFNTHLGAYVMCINRSNNGDFTMHGGQTNWWCVSRDLINWSEPQPFVLPDASLGNWYGEIIGLDADSTDKRAGAQARLYILQSSAYYANFKFTASTARRLRSQSR